MLEDTSRFILTQLKAKPRGRERVICKEKARVTFSEWFSLYELWWPGPVVPEKTVGEWKDREWGGRND